ncbi:MAG: WXG100 family type VII secretion target [Nocardioides sp.]
MDLDGFRVDHAGLDRVADDLMAVVNRIDARLQGLEGDLAPLRTQWVGDAQRAYVVAQAQWDTAIREMRDLLRGTAHQVTLANDAYRAADTRGARAFGG